MRGRDVWINRSTDGLRLIKIERGEIMRVSEESENLGK